MSDAPKVSKEAAEEEFFRFASTMGLDVDEASMSEEDGKSLRETKGVLLSALMRGHLSIDESGLPTLYPDDGAPIVFKEPDGAALMAMDAHKGELKKLFAVAAAVTGQPIVRFARMKQRDNKIVMKLIALFLAG